MPFLATCLPVMTQKLAMAAKNPTKPHFNHYLFEALALSIRIVCKGQPTAVSNIETVLFPVFQQILVEDVQEFQPYVFQILSLLLEFQTSGTIPQPYMELFAFLLMPVLWERPGNIKPLVRLIQACIKVGPAQIVGLNKIESLLGVFQKLIASKGILTRNMTMVFFRKFVMVFFIHFSANDHEGFNLLQAMIEFIPKDVMNQYIKQIFTLLFQRLTSSKTTKFVKSFLVFSFLFTCQYGGGALQECIDQIQPGMFGMVIERLVILEVQKVSGLKEKKICAVGMTKWLCETPQFLNGSYSQYWPKILQTLVGFFELPQDETVPDDERFIELEESPGYQTSYRYA